MGYTPVTQVTIGSEAKSGYPYAGQLAGLEMSRVH